MFFGKKKTILFSTECLSYYDWQTIALYNSIKTSNADSRVVRLLACDNYDETKDFTRQYVKTFVHENMRNSHLVLESDYPSYNKPFSIKTYLEVEEDDSEYFVIIDSDMIVRNYIDPSALGVKQGTVFSSEYEHLVGADNEFKKRFLVTQHNVDKVGGIYIVHKSDALNIATLWFEYTKKVRSFMKENLDVFLKETLSPSDYQDKKKQEQAQWHSEMYGYIFAASHLNIKHKTRSGFLLHMGYHPTKQIEPTISHYSIDFKVDDVVFDKSNYLNLYINECQNFYFSNTELKYDMEKKDIIEIEVLNYLNNGLCNFYDSYCEVKCSKYVRNKIKKDSNTFKELWVCNDQHEKCSYWKDKGECDSNPNFMNDICTLSCGKCTEVSINNNSFTNISLIIIMTFTTTFVLYKFYKYLTKKDTPKSHIV